MHTTDLEARVERLENQLRAARGHNRAVVAGLAALFLAGAYPARPEIQEEVRTRRLEVVDAAGRAVIELRAGDTGGRIALYADEGSTATQVPASISVRGVLDRDEDGALRRAGIQEHPAPSRQPQVLLESGSAAGLLRIRSREGAEATLSPVPQLSPF